MAHNVVREGDPPSAPLFTDYDGGNYTLGAGSPCIDALPHGAGPARRGHSLSDDRPESGREQLGDRGLRVLAVRVRRRSRTLGLGTDWMS